jgi:hypothetical protein
MGYLKKLSPATYKRLKAYNVELLKCHACAKEFQVGDLVVFDAGSGNKKYHIECADKHNVTYTVGEENVS